ncbi:TadE/TadG family type IV pilus assembly protein [Streptantibioticus ferralitis]|uniref:TadE/TadG family type IV pilus assembly protein n=1 Tax=Streptantibioticus ferralitis TaxID=236510 RepID=A0ABT5Z3J9_9ACTN|nr:TadE/TadG family type IV pilus assembly protein [Streptantibioticus ferralitis]MDF2258378.1 TadE/TadG family type IV pilus assembly protein [Streptantibioticus ferralitis]
MPPIETSAHQHGRTAARVLAELRRDERGEVTAELVIIMPLVLTLVLLLAQAALWFHASHIAQATAANALSATRVQGGTTAAGQQEAQRTLDQLGHGPLHTTHIDITRNTHRAEVRISGTASSVVPFLHLPVHAQAAGPTEKFKPGQAAS